MKLIFESDSHESGKHGYAGFTIRYSGICEEDKEELIEGQHLIPNFFMRERFLWKIGVGFSSSIFALLFF